MSLADLLDRQLRMAPIEAVRLLLPLCSALEVVHRKGIVHRDLKPDNVMIVEGSEEHRVPKLVDFGIVKLLEPTEAPARPLTQDGSVVGTPDYMSPEQARGRLDVDARSDIWSLSVVLYEMLCGRRPFRAANYLALIQAIIEQPAPGGELPASEPDLWAIIEKGLAKDPAQRWPSMRELGRALAGWCQARGVETDSTGASLAAHWLLGSEMSTSALGIKLVVPGPEEPRSSHPTLDELFISRVTPAPENKPSTGVRPRRQSPSLLTMGITLGTALAVLGVWVGRTHLAGHEATSSATAPPPAPPVRSVVLQDLPGSGVAPPLPASAAAPAASATAASSAPAASALHPIPGKKPLRMPVKSTGVGDMPLPTSPTF
jgi:serine/threonine protein kinase